MPDPFSPYIKGRRRRRSGYETNRHIEWQKVYRSDCATACLRPFRSHGKSCCAVGCTNRYEKGTNQSFYRFPVDSVEPNRRARWTAAVNRKNWIGVTAHTSSPDQKATILSSPSYVPTVFSYVESLVKVVGTVKVTKSNLHDFWYRCLVMGLIHIHKVLCRSQLVCNNYRRNKTFEPCEVSSNSRLIDGSYSNCSIGKGTGMAVAMTLSLEDAIDV